MVHSLKDLQTHYGESGAREKFEQLCSLLIKSEFPQAKAIRVHKGDGGVDTSVGDWIEGSTITVFQQKYFIAGVGDSQKNQIREAYDTARNNSRFTLGKWILCIPIDLSQDEQSWWDNWKKNQDTKIELWPELQLMNLLLQIKNSGIKEHFFQEATTVQIRETHEMVKSFTELVTPINLSQKPIPPTRPLKFEGREKELEQLRENLAKQERTTLMAVVGFGGMGKTTLAKELANMLFYNTTFCIVLWADITPQPNKANILKMWGKYAGLDFSSDYDEQVLKGVAHQIKIQLDELVAKKWKTAESERTLVLLDDVWENGLETARLLLEACPSNSSILITTRSQSLAIDLDAHIQVLGRLNPEESVKLLKAYFLKCDDNLLEMLGKVLAGHPLALTLAARRIRKNNNPDKNKVIYTHIEEYKHGVAEGINFKALKLDQGDSRDDSLEIAFSYTYNELSNEDKRRFRSLGILASDQRFDHPILTALWQTPSEQDIEEYCDNLKNSSLVENAKGGYGEGGFGMGVYGDALYGQGWDIVHPLIQNYANAILQLDEAEYLEVLARFVDHVTNLKEQFLILPLEKHGELFPYLPQIAKAGKVLADVLEKIKKEQETDSLEKTKNLASIFLPKIIRFAKQTYAPILKQFDVDEQLWVQMGIVAQQLSTL